jgi:Dolichyl-phosphate-mannose-protein mannosyltransferase
MTTQLSTDPALPPPPSRPPVAWRPVLVVTAVVVLGHLAVATRYGWHRDEFYYVICGQHPAWGYVDQPPLTPVLAALFAKLPGGVLPLRLLAIAAEAGCVLLAPLLAAEFGGGRRAQTITAAAVAACPAFVAASLLFGTTVVDQVVWIALLVLLTRALRLGSTRAWLAAGLVAGIGLENKDTVAVLLLGIALGLVLLRREVLRTPGPWLAGVLAVVLAAPNLIWDAAHGWPNLAMAASLSREQGGPLGALAQLPILPILLAGPPLIALWVIGVRRLGSSAGREHRWLLVAAIVVVVLVTAAGGKSYYPAPLLAALFAAGAVRVEALSLSRNKKGHPGWPIAITVTALFAVFIGLPVLPISTAGTIRSLNPTVVETYGWPGYVDQVKQAAATLPPGTPIFTGNYGEAGALTLLGPAQGLHNPVLSAQNNYSLWGPPPGTPDTVLCVGQWTPTDLRKSWSQVTEIAPVTMNGIPTQETTQHAVIYLCRNPRGSWAQLWPQLTHFD